MPRITADEFDAAKMAGTQLSAQLREIREMKPGDYIKVPHEGLWHSSQGNSCTIRLQVHRMNEAARAEGSRTRYSSWHSPKHQWVYVRCERVPEQQDAR
jgi:hypothetical protein